MGFKPGDRLDHVMEYTCWSCFLNHSNGRRFLMQLKTIGWIGQSAKRWLLRHRQMDYCMKIELYLFYILTDKDGLLYLHSQQKPLALSGVILQQASNRVCTASLSASELTWCIKTSRTHVMDFKSMSLNRAIALSFTWQLIQQLTIMQEKG